MMLTDERKIEIIEKDSGDGNSYRRWRGFMEQMKKDTTMIGQVNRFLVIMITFVIVNFKKYRYNAFWIYRFREQ